MDRHSAAVALNPGLIVGVTQSLRSAGLAGDHGVVLFSSVLHEAARNGGNADVERERGRLDAVVVGGVRTETRPNAWSYLIECRRGDGRELWAGGG